MGEESQMLMKNLDATCESLESVSTGPGAEREGAEAGSSRLAVGKIEDNSITELWP